MANQDNKSMFDFLEDNERVFEEFMGVTDLHQLNVKFSSPSTKLKVVILSLSATISENPFRFAAAMLWKHIKHKLTEEEIQSLKDDYPGLSDL